MEAKRRAGAALLDLTISNPTEVLPRYPHARIAGALAAIEDFTYRPHPLGSEIARSHIAQLYCRRGLTISPGQIALTASSSESYSLLFKLLCNPGDEVLVPVPSYPLFEYLAALECVRTVPYRLAYDGNWSIDFAHLRGHLSSQSRAIVVVSPNNPTGSFLKVPELAQLVEIARERDIAIISDEVFMDFASADDPWRAPPLASRDSALVFCLNGLSKMAAMPQMKLGWIVIGGPPDARDAARERLELLLDTYLSVNSPVQAALPDLFAIGAEMRQTLKRTIETNLHALTASFEGEPVHALHAEGGWSAILRLPNIESEEVWITRLLEEHNLIVQPGYFFDMDSEPYIVVSLITSETAFAEGLSRIRRLATTA